MKKLSSIFLILMLVIICLNCENLPDSSIIKIKQITCDLDNSTKVNNPILGMDFWESPKIYKGNSVDWTAEFEKEE
jgi:hypothetical protein